MHICDEELIKIHEGLIYKLAKSFYNSDIEDLYQVGVIGLLRAKENFKSDSKTKFSTYAYEYIYGEMYALTEKNRGIKISREILQLCKQIEKVRQKLTQTQGKEPSIEDLAAYIEKPVELIYQALNSANSIISYDTESDTSGAIIDTIATKNDVDVIEKLAIEESMDTLNDTEKQIIDLRYYQDYTQSETAEIMNMTQVMISRYEKRSKEKMRSYLVG